MADRTVRATLGAATSSRIQTTARRVTRTTADPRPTRTTARDEPTTAARAPTTRASPVASDTSPPVAALVPSSSASAARVPGSAIPSISAIASASISASSSSSLSPAAIGAIAGVAGAVVLVGALAAIFVIRRRRRARRRQDFGPALYDATGRRRSRSSKGLFPLSSEADDLEVKSKSAAIGRTSSSTIAPSSSVSVRHRSSRDYGSPSSAGPSPGPFAALMREPWHHAAPPLPLSPPVDTVFQPLPYHHPRTETIATTRLDAPTNATDRPNTGQSDDGGPRAFAFPPVPMRTRSDTVSDPDFIGVSSPTSSPPRPLPSVKLQRRPSAQTQEEIRIVNPGAASHQLVAPYDAHSRQASYSTLPPSPQREESHAYAAARAHHHGARPESIAILARATAHANRMSVLDEPTTSTQGGGGAQQPYSAFDMTASTIWGPASGPDTSVVPQVPQRSQPADQSLSVYAPTTQLPSPSPQSLNPYGQSRQPPSPGGPLISPSLFSSFDHSLLDLNSPTEEAARLSSYVVTPHSESFGHAKAPPPPPTPATAPLVKRAQSPSSSSILDSYAGGSSASVAHALTSSKAIDAGHKTSPSYSSTFLDALMNDDDPGGIGQDALVPPHIANLGGPYSHGSNRSSDVPEQLDEHTGRAS